MKTETKRVGYLEFKRDQEKIMNEFESIFYAFNDKQFEEGMEKFGLDKADTGKIASLGGGGYILKDKSKAFYNMVNEFSNGLEAGLKEEVFLLEALTYELQNHEYNYTGELEQAFAALGITMEDIESLSFGIEVLKKARTVAGKDC